VFALVDGNNFYCSCEQVFQPQLRNKPLVVLSNNDGCAIARSAEAKSMGIKMGQPFHELKPLVKQGLLAQSANFTLYGDMSARVVSILRDECARVEVYSIDESFLDLSGTNATAEQMRALRDRIRRWTGIPNCIGIGPTKTLAKLANKVAKKGQGVVDLSTREAQEHALERFPTEDVWGVGSRWNARLAGMGITTARQLRDAPSDLILSTFGVVLARTQRELQGHSCIALEEAEPDRKQIVVSRSFGQRVNDHQAVHEALATFATRACEKLRSRDLTVASVSVFVHSDAFRPELRQHHPSRTAQLLKPASDTRVVLEAVRRMTQGLLKTGIEYKKAGVVLMDLARPEAVEADLFGAPTIGNDALMGLMDRINQKYGRGTVGFGATGWQEKPQWGMKQAQLSRKYTTSLRDVPLATC
jgi:DNA polymerase V